MEPPLGTNGSKSTLSVKTEFAYSVESDEHDAPDGVRFDPNLGTAGVG